MNNHIDKLNETADTLGVKYSPNIGVDKLQAKIDAMEQLSAEQKALMETPKDAKPKVSKKPRKVSDVEIRIMKAREPKKVKIVNMDPQNRAATTVFSSVCNMVMDLQKVIPLNTVIALEECLCQEVENRSYTSSEPEIDKMGQPTGNFTTIAAPVYQVIRY